MRKKMLSILLAVAVLAAAMTSFASAASAPGVAAIGGFIFLENGELASRDQCPTITITMTNTRGASTVKACGGKWACNAAIGEDVTIVPELAGYTFIPEKVTVKNIQGDNLWLNFKIRPVEEPIETLPELFVDNNFQGSSMTVGEGRYLIRDLQAIGNDRLSSLKVPEGWKVTLYEHGQFKGRTLVCESDIARLADHKFNDIMSSLVVEKVAVEDDSSASTAPAVNKVVLYSNVSFEGASLELAEGRYDINDLGPVGNDSLSSIKVPEGYSVYLYADAGFKGECRLCTTDIANLGGNNEFNDKTSSIVVVKD